MATRIQLTDSNALLRSPALLNYRHTTCRPARFLPKAAVSDQNQPSSTSIATSKTRRQIIAETAGSLLLAPTIGFPGLAKSDEPDLSEWERVFLPIDPGVVLLDIAFVPDDPSHGNNHV